MIPFVVSRKPADFDQFMKIWKWCEAAFGKPCYFTTWDGDFADHTDDWVRFKFYKDEMASAFVMQWGDYCLTKDEQYKLGIISLQEM
jgi:hypothetical protein